MSDGPREIGHREIGHVPYVPVLDADGAVSFPLIVGVEDGQVTISAPGVTLWKLSKDARELFMRLFFDAERAAEEWAEDRGEAPRAETDCQCHPGDPCPCEADGPDGLCACCRSNDHDGSCAGSGRD